MMNVIPLYRPHRVRPFVRGLALGAAVIALGMAADATLAGECPADKRVADGQGQKPGPGMPSSIAVTPTPTCRRSRSTSRAGSSGCASWS